jgi:heavy metal sensor kinase
LYFLVLLGLALGAVSVLAYQNSQRLLVEKAGTRRDLLERLYKDNCREVNDALDLQLIHQAELLASQAEIQFRGSWVPAVRYVAPLSALAATAFPVSAWATPFWAGQEPHRGYVEHVQRMLMTEINFTEDHRDPEEHKSEVEYFQINSDWGSKQWRSQSLKALGEVSFPFEMDMFQQTPLFEPKLDEIELSPGLHVRRATYKAPIARLTIFPPRFPAVRPGRSSRPPYDPGAAKRSEQSFRPQARPTRAIFIQYGLETTQRDAELAALKNGLDEELAAMKAKSSEDLRTLRNVLLLVSLATFGSCVVGGILLVRAGLSPLQRLSFAVSQVSARDFRLPFDKRYLPVELRPIVDRLCQTLELLKRAFAREKQAAADISHELRTPLAALLTTIEVGLRKPRAPDEYRELLEDCHATGQQMSHLVERLLALARLDAGVDQLRYQTSNVAALAEECADLVRPLADARGLELNVHHDGPINVQVDPNKIREILNNLLHNAIEYNRQGGKVDLSVSQHNGRLRLEVADTGIGIAPEARERIFERFYRADASREATGLHAGLGLAIVKGYVDLMGGTITVESAAGAGSTFRLELPIRQPAPSSPMLVKASA